MEKDFHFKVGRNPTLTLEDLFAEVEIEAGSTDIIRINLEGDEKLIEKFSAEKTSIYDVRVKGQPSTVQITSRHGNVSTSIRGNIKGSIISVSGGDVTIINGKIVSGHADVINFTENTQPLKISIIAPIGTNLDFDGVRKLTSRDLKGKVSAKLSGQEIASLISAIDAKVGCSGQSSCILTNVWGNVTLECSGQSRINIKGNFQDIDAESSGQSYISISGDCRNFLAEASGASRIELSGQVSGRMKERTSGVGRVRII